MLRASGPGFGWRLRGTRRRTQDSDESAPHQLSARETTSHGDLLKSFFASLDHPLCCFDADLPNDEAVACGFNGKKKEVSEQVVGRVRDRAFTVRITSSSGVSDRTVLREKAQKVAEQVAGFLF